MHVLVTGGTGYVGRFVVAALAAAGHEVTLLGRRPGMLAWSFAEPAPRLPAADALVHLALDHLSGAFRGGEGDDPARFWRLNVEGTRALFDTAEAAGVRRTVFLSSRAVYGDHRRGETLRETDPPAPGSFYGETKLAGERALHGRGVSLRATGVYGGRPHKWEGLFATYLAGEPVAPRCATEVHGDDLAAAVILLLAAPEGALGDGVFNASDILLDRHDLLEGVRARSGCPHPPPPRAEGPPPGVMATGRLSALGWRPGGWTRLEAFLDTVVPPGGGRVI